MAVILDASRVCDGFDVRVRLDDDSQCIFHFLTPPADLAALAALEAAVAELIAQRALAEQADDVDLEDF